MRLLNEIFYNDQTMHWVKSLQIRSFFWSAFSRNRTEYGDLLFSSNTEKYGTEKNSVFGHFSRSDGKSNWHFWLTSELDFVIVKIETKIVWQIRNISFCNFQFAIKTSTLSRDKTA